MNYKYLLSDIKKNPYLKIYYKKDNVHLLSKKYQLIINCDLKNKKTKKYFYKRFSKDYASCAYTSIIKHKEISPNNVAVQIFTKNGPLAFLPISNKKTSLVYSFVGKKDFEFKREINKFNYKYQILEISEPQKFKLISRDLRNYHYENILAFGDLLHKIHPLAGQGFNMSIRDIRELLEIIQFKINHGLEIDRSVCIEFEKKRKHKNFIFSNGINSIHELFKYESKNKILSKLIKFLGKNTLVNKTFRKLADDGILI